MTILLIIVGMVVFLVLFTKFVLFYTEKAVSILVVSKHRDAEMIVDSGIAPPAWNRIGPIRLVLPQLARYRALRRMGRIIKYFEHTPMVENDEVRGIILTKLRTIRDDWRGKDWGGIYPYVSDRGAGR